ncbi:MAG TPA: NAD(P)-binding domain-containing protein, partial [Thermoanaerobaculia bacterium]|nr:NAD(P)-binding domain-containing protein [Thermoanaerobaculia bacterium]
MQPRPPTGAAKSRSAPLADLTFALAGAGRVGGSLARWALAAGARLTAVASRGAGSPAARQLAAEAGCPLVALDELESAGSDLLLVAVADTALDAVADRLARRPQARVALHTAGS